MLLALPWFLFTVTLSMLGLVWAWKKPPRTLPEISIVIALFYISVGGVWLLLSRSGFRPMGFDDVIVLLTAVHFHYAGFIAPVLAGLIGREAVIAPYRKAYNVAAFGVIVGVPLLALGITFSPALEILAAIVFTVSLSLLAGLQLCIAARCPYFAAPARALLLVSSLSVAVAMIYAVIYAAGEFTGLVLVDIPEMAHVHGTLNACGFSLCGIAGWQWPRVKPEDHTC